MLADIARATEGETLVTRIEAILVQKWLHRDRGRVVLFGTTGQKLKVALAEHIEKSLPLGKNTLAESFVDNVIAAKPFSIFRILLMGEASATIRNIACHTCQSSRGMMGLTR